MVTKPVEEQGGLMPDLIEQLFMTNRDLEVREQARTFVDDEITARSSDLEGSTVPELDLARSFGKHGWFGLTIPTRYDGIGAGQVAKTAVLEAISQVSPPMGYLFQAYYLGVAKILHHGTDVQQGRWLPAIARGDCLPTIAVTEPGAGGNIGQTRATAERRGDTYVLNGVGLACKTFVGGSHNGADLHGVIARTPGTSGIAGLTALLVEADRPGVVLGEPRVIDGFSFGDVGFEDCEVPALNLIGAEGQGMHVAQASSTLYGRLNLAAVGLGIMSRVLDGTVRFLKQRPLHPDARSLDQLQVNQQKLGKMQSLYMSTRTDVYAAAAGRDRGWDGVELDAALNNAKLQSYVRGQELVALAKDIHSAYGLVGALPRDAVYLDHLISPAGTPDFQRYRLFQHAMGTERSSWSARFPAQVQESAEL
ncbi:acyl-CoA dehydrogenase family protein [Saccharopolyspora endophytica]|uniref:Acyl-CoA/acyl-ACP dehydrogenase n=1 Tax=Saccharopolyspora endophytica TaxID=543886 RepID=A0ABS5DCR1_9PSEU|nr:acyl-CoA dehydrogenase family protein [Saccharopolyspora endophytica]MBQ0924064.1 acyl-CoA/acyl-ACP dehydrogenase [Saccharopolyspora endophytica]